MTVYGASDPQVIGQPISPFFGAQNGLKYVGQPIIPLPNLASGGPIKPILESVGRGDVPANALVNTINGVSVGAQGAGGDPCSVAELISSGNGNQSNGGTAAAAIGQSVGENQQITVGLSALALTENGPTPINVDTTGLAPVAGGLNVALLGLQAGGFQG